jgi:hypothetical protein
MNGYSAKKAEQLLINSKGKDKGKFRPRTGHEDSEEQ